MTAEHDSVTPAPADEGDIKGTVFNIQRYSIQDGPGIRTTVFLKGCPLRCAWCSNPESQNAKPEVAHRDSLCIRCGRCTDVCPQKAISTDENGIFIDRQLCKSCARCVDACPQGALKMYGVTMTSAEVFQQVRKDAEFYRGSGGGVTVSGGEPLFQPDFVAALLKLCRDNGIETCIETCGLAKTDALNKVLPYLSQVLFDIKLADSNDHLKWTQAPNEAIVRNLRIVAASGIPLIIRIPLIPGINDTEDELRKIAEIISENVKKPVKVNLLPYHKFGMGKYQMLDREYQLGELDTQTKDQLQEAKQLIESYGFECDIEG